MTLAFALASIFFALWVISQQISYANQMRADEFRFKYFALRDRLAMLVVTGKIAENSWEYKNVVAAINFHIAAVETVSILRIVKMISEYHNSKKEEQTVSFMSQKIDNVEIKQIMIDFLCLTAKLLQRNSRAQIWALNLFLKLRWKSPSKDIKLEVAKPKSAIEKIQSSVSSLENSLPSNMACA